MGKGLTPSTSVTGLTGVGRRKLDDKLKKSKKKKERDPNAEPAPVRQSKKRAAS